MKMHGRAAGGFGCEKGVGLLMLLLPSPLKLAAAPEPPKLFFMLVWSYPMARAFLSARMAFF